MAPSAGNAAGALAAYGAAAKLPVVVAMPDDTPRAFVDECRHYGAKVEARAGHDRRRRQVAARATGHHRTAARSTSRRCEEPYRVEGKKTMAYELHEQLEGELPDVIVYPTGGGTGLVGMWKAFGEMRALGWPLPRNPRLVSVQAAGCAPVVRAFVGGAAKTEPFPNPTTRAWGLRVPSPIGGFLCLRALRETHGTADRRRRGVDRAGGGVAGGGERRRRLPRRRRGLGRRRGAARERLDRARGARGRVQHRHRA